MDSVLKKIQINLDKLNCKNTSILISVSGGRDSMTLLDALNKLKDKYSFSLYIAYINHNLRDKESSQEEKFVKDSIKKLSLPLYVYTIDKELWESLKNESVEMAARRIRYDFLKKTAKSKNIDYIATAHNLNDKIETFFLQLFRAGGTETLRSIPFKNKNVIRPMINVSRKKINEYINNNSIKYFEDSSNKANTYKRNIIRNKLLPIFNDIHPNYQKSFKHIFSYINEEQKLLNKLTILKYNKIKIFSTEKYVCLKKDKYQTMNKVFKKKIIKHILKMLNYPTLPGLSLINYLVEKKNKYRIEKKDLLCLSSGNYLWFINKKRINKIQEIEVKKIPYKNNNYNFQINESSKNNVDLKRSFVFSLYDHTLPIVIRNIYLNDKINTSNKKNESILKVLKRLNIPIELYPEVIVLESKGTMVGFFLNDIFRVSVDFYIKDEDKKCLILNNIK